jgi:hypothetical protein
MEVLFGDTHTVFGRRLGFLAGLNYKNEYRYFDKRLRSYEANGFSVFSDKTAVEGVIDYQWGALVNLSLELNDDHDLSFNFLRVQSAEDYAGRAIAASTPSRSSTQTTVSDEAATASATVAASIAPLPTRSPARPSVRFQTVVRCPAARKAAASARPMAPSPITDTESGAGTDSESVETGAMGAAKASSEELMPPTVKVHGPGSKYRP